MTGVRGKISEIGRAVTCGYGVYESSTVVGGNCNNVSITITNTVDSL